MTAKPRKPTTTSPVTGKVAGREPKPLTLAEVTYRDAKGRKVRRYSIHKRVSTHFGTMTQYVGWPEYFLIWDRVSKRSLPDPRVVPGQQAHVCGIGWVNVVDAPPFRLFRSKKSAENYLKRTSDEAYRLEMLNRCLDRGKDVA
jgi:hypothetical protein